MNLWKKGLQAQEQHFAFGSSKVGRGPQTSIRTELAMPKDVQMPFWSWLLLAIFCMDAPPSDFEFV
jgi:hypothetical protein